MFSFGKLKKTNLKLSNLKKELLNLDHDIFSCKNIQFEERIKLIRLRSQIELLEYALVKAGILIEIKKEPTPAFDYQSSNEGEVKYYRVKGKKAQQ